MQAIEFETHLENGLIHLPVSYQHWQEGKHVKVIVLVDESADDRSEQQNRKSINHHAGKISLTQDPLDFQKDIRDEWA
ncbi:hypothetical protein [Methylobacter sp.]|uniref:hypothetical protein n=1 Tax=Methylobacter sp. TaxID=2051955 RepID=UPI002FDED503